MLEFDHVKVVRYLIKAGAQARLCIKDLSNVFSNQFGISSRDLDYGQ